MSLHDYLKKRTKKTPEPLKETEEGGEGIFVVQKHNATRLHYDLRLELGGVLKSWAVPKGPSLNPKDKRLAIMVEDHPFEYKDFEGVIPKGSCGAGEVIVWDTGTYRALGTSSKNDSESAVRGGLQKGKISFILNGKKLKGEFALARMNGDSWLLIKKEDEFASGEDIKMEENSVLSGGSLEKMGEKFENKKIDVTQLKKHPPEFIAPMLATLTEKPFDKAGWIFEIKWDGYRAIASIDDGDVRLYSRNGNSYKDAFPLIYSSLKSIKRNVVLDGEIVVLDNEGKAHFEMIQNYRRKPTGTLVYYVFDILFLDDFDLRELHLKDRKELLEKLFQSEKINGPIKISEYVEKNGIDFFNLIVEKDIEGVVAKNLNSIYKSGKRSEEWLKIKHQKTQDAIICGYTEGRGGRRLGAVILGVFNNGKLQYIGHTGTGFDEERESDLLEKLSAIEIEKSPFKDVPDTNAPAHWVTPKYLCEIRFSEWTNDGVMRQPVFLGMRPDKRTEEAVLENKVVPPRIELLQDRNTKDKKIDVGGELITIANFKKKLWNEGFTKMDLVEYYLKIAPVILPYLKDRPQSLHRFPHGVEAEGFYQKDTSELNLPKWVETVQVHSDSDEKDVQYLICQNEMTLAYMANLGCIELNPWNSRKGSLEKPDYLVIDLDPEEIPFSQVVVVAKECHKILSDLNIKSYCKTSGATGLHIYVPLQAKYTNEQARVFAEIIANLTHRATPLISSVERNPKKRKKKVYVDYLQNRRGQTLAAPYSIRPLPGVPVSTPLRWEEVNEDLKPSNFTAKNIFERLDKVGDLWKPILTESANILEALEKLNEKTR